MEKGANLGGTVIAHGDDDLEPVLAHILLDTAPLAFGHIKALDAEKGMDAAISGAANDAANIDLALRGRSVDRIAEARRKARMQEHRLLRAIGTDAEVAESERRLREDAA